MGCAINNASKQNKMDKTLQQQVFEYIKDAADKIGDFAVKEIPPFIHEFLTWKFVEAGAYVAIWCFFFILFASVYGTWLYKRAGQIKKSLDDVGGEASVFVISSILSGSGLMVSFFAAFVPNAFVMLQIHFAPKVYLIEYASQYLK